MLFNSYIFILLFLPATLLGYFLLNRFRLILAGKIYLLAASLFFYSWWKISYLPLLLSSILFNYLIARVLIIGCDRKWPHRFRKSIFIIGILFNVSLLGFFKYMDFFIGNVNQFFQYDFNLLHLVLPLAISFFTLQQIAFLVDVYEGLTREQRLIDYALFVSFFPQLIAGPIVHHNNMMPQFARLRNKTFQDKNFALGLFTFAVGLFKKVAIADAFAFWATSGFDHTPTLNFIEAWVTSLSYTFQLYFDFSGYTDMAVGLGLMFNIKIPNNFNSPYRSASIIDFWKRWHITLTNFITTYVYTPLVRCLGNITFSKSLAALLLAMFISGFWHGAGWTFVIWGLLHGLALCLNHFWRKRKLKLPRLLAWLLTFNFVNISFVIFRARQWPDALKVLQGMFGFNEIV